MNDTELVLNIVKLLGDKPNILDITNCMTRLRVEVKEPILVKIDELKNLDGVLAVINSRKEHIEIVLGPGRCRKCADICHEMGFDNKNVDVKEDWKENKKIIKNDNNKFKTILKSFGDIFVPLLYGIIASGFCAGFAMIISSCVPSYENIPILNFFYQIFNLIKNSFMTYITAWCGYRAAEKFGVTPILGGMIGMITNMDGINEISKILGMWNETMPLESILRAGRGGVLAVIFCVFIMSYVEKWFRKRIPENLDIVLTPILTLIVCLIPYVLVIIPIMGYISFGICNLVKIGCMSSNVFIRIFVGYISTTLFLPLVAMGMHHGLVAIYSIQIETQGFVTLYPSLAMAGAGQVGAAIALYFMAKKVNNNICKVIKSAIVPGVLGIGEPLIYGVTIPLGKPFITAGLGAGFGGAYVMLKQVASTTWGPSGVLGILVMTAGPNSAIQTMIYYIIGLIISVVMGFVFTYFFIDKNILIKD